MNSKLLFVLLFFCACHSSQESKINYPIFWKKDFNLSWANYKGIAPSNPPHDCRSFVRLYCAETTEEDTTTYEIRALFTEDSAFCVNGKETDYLLNHEQKHFDLTEVYARMLRKYLTEFSGKCNLDSFYLSGRDSIRVAGWRKQDTYDDESNHSLNTEKQKFWDNYTDSLLNAYGNYEDPFVKIKRPKGQEAKYTNYPDLQ